MLPSPLSCLQFPPERLARAKRGTSVSVCLPARDEAATVGAIVSTIVGLGELVDEVLVVDDGSSDGTGDVAAAAGASVVPGPARGKGAALRAGLDRSKGDVVVFCDADVRAFDAAFVTGLLGPLLTDESIGFVKGRYARPGDGGRVTELVARPLIRLRFPELAGFDQPLAGEVAGRRNVLEQVEFEPGYGVDLALLIDVIELIGLDAVAQVDLGRRVHRNRSLAELGPQAEAVLAAGLARAGARAR